MALIKAGASVRETCIHADKRIEEETGKAFKKDKQLQKGKTNCIYVILFVKFLQAMSSKMGLLNGKYFYVEFDACTNSRTSGANGRNSNEMLIFQKGISRMILAF